MKRYLLLFILIFLIFKIYAQNSKKYHTLSGYVRDESNGEALFGALIFIKEIKSGTTSNSYGFYSITLPEAIYHVKFKFMGYQSDSIIINLKENKTYNSELKESVTQLKTITIEGGNENDNISRNEMSINKLESKTIKQIPALMGEVDVIKAIQMLPGVQPTAEGTSGFSVRGGSYDQNLILLDEATVYNASHLMGFFSVFNNDAIKDLILYKADIPANYGGRLSSVLDVRMKEGNNKKYEFTGGLGLISSRLTLEGPVINENNSFLLSGRRTYADLFFPFTTDSNLQKSTMYFYDLNFKLNHSFNNHNRIFVSAYTGRDIFSQENTATMGFGNQTATIRWNHIFSDRIFMNLSGIYSKYNYSLFTTLGGADYHWNSALIDYSLKADFNYYLNPSNELKFGIVSTYHFLEPCDAYIKGNGNTISVPYPDKYALENGFYINNSQKITNELNLKYGLRYSFFQNLGSAEVYLFDESYREIGKQNYSKGKIFNTQDGIEPRFGANYIINPHSSVKLSYTRTVQYLQLATNSSGGMPLDIWFPASPNVKPQKADQYAAGYFKNLFNNSFETSIELYYKNMIDVIDFKDHAQLLMNPRMEGEIRTGSAYSYGLELFLKKNAGKLTGWVSYTYSRIFRKIKEINDGKRYPASYDKPNNLNIILSYEINKRSAISANWIYATGAPTTFPVATFHYNNTVNKVYSSRNGYRLRDYHRLDLSYTLKGKNNPKRFWQGEWVFSIYNAYGRHNDWMINFIEDTDSGTIKAERWYLPFTFFPGITYNFNFKFNKK